MQQPLPGGALLFVGRHSGDLRGVRQCGSVKDMASGARCLFSQTCDQYCSLHRGSPGWLNKNNPQSELSGPKDVPEKHSIE